MDDNTNTHRPPRKGTFVLRWASCTLLVVGVFAVSRLTARVGDAPGPANATSSGAPQAGDAATRPTAGPEVDPAPWDLGMGGPLAAFDGLVEELFGRSTHDASSTDTEDPSHEPADWVTAGGPGATGGNWTITYPADWKRRGTDPGVMLFSAPDYPDVAAVITRPFSGSLSDEADRDLDRMMPGMADGVLVSVADVDFAGREAIRAELRYTNPDGNSAAVNVIWIRDSENLYVVAGEAEVDNPDLQATVDQTLDSFTMSETA